MSRVSLIEGFPVGSGGDLSHEAVQPATSGAWPWEVFVTSGELVPGLRSRRIPAQYFESRLRYKSLSMPSHWQSPTMNTIPFAMPREGTTPSPGRLLYNPRGTPHTARCLIFCLPRPRLSLLRAIARSPGACAKSAGSEPSEPLSAALVGTAIPTGSPQSSCHEHTMKSV